MFTKSYAIRIVAGLLLLSRFALAEAAPKREQAQIDRTGKLSVKTHRRRIQRLASTKRGSGREKRVATNKRGFTVVVPQNAPKDWSPLITWDRDKDSSSLFLIYVNAAQMDGVSIAGAQTGDRLEILDVSGVASFTKDKGNPLAAGISTLVAVGANAGLVAFGQAELVPVVTAADAFAQKQFKATGVKHKRRDGFGLDPGTGHRARQEGGVIVCMPGAGTTGTLYSGNSSHKNRWIKKNERRFDAIRPQHVARANGFFLVRGSTQQSRRRIQTDDHLITFLAWDHKFEDNAGYYRLLVKLTRDEFKERPIPRITRSKKVLRSRKISNLRK